MNKKLSFAVENITPIEDETLDKSQFSLLKVDAFATGRSLHDTFTTEENLRKNAATLIQKPFVFFTDTRFDDAGGHDDGEVAAGFVPHNSRLEFRTLADGRIMLSCDVLVWKRYSGDLIRFFKRDGGRKSVSVELEIIDARPDRASGLLELVTYCFNAITCLGDFIRPAIPNAEAVMQFSKDFEEAKQNFETKFSDKYTDIDFTIPKSVRRSATKSLDLRKEKGKGGSAESLSIARHLSRNEKSNSDKVRRIGKFFQRQNIYDDLLIGLHGGKAAKTWSLGICQKMSEIDNQRVSYFTDSDASSFAEDNTTSIGEEELNMAKKKEEAVVEPENTEVAMAAPEKEETTSEEQEPKEEMAAPEEKPEGEETQTEEMSEKEDEFSFGFDTSVAMGLMADDEFAKVEFAKGKDANFGLLMSRMYDAMYKYAEMCKDMATEKEAYMSRISELESFKASIENQQKEFAVDLTLKELSEKFAIPEDTISDMRTQGYETEFSKLDDWKLSVKAKSVDFAIVKQGKEEGIVVRVGLPVLYQNITAKKDIWS